MIRDPVERFLLTKTDTQVLVDLGTIQTRKQSTIHSSLTCRVVNRQGTVQGYFHLSFLGTNGSMATSDAPSTVAANRSPK